MNTRERFLSIMNFEKPDRPILWEFGYWAETMRNWYKQGLVGDPTPFEENTTVAGEVQPWPMPSCLKDRDVHEFFDLDASAARVDIKEWFLPLFEYKVLSEDNDSKIIIDEWGVKQRASKIGNRVPQFLEFPVKSRFDFYKLKDERLNLSNLKDRLPSNWEEKARSYNKRSCPLGIGGYPVGFFGSLRWLMGDKLYYNFYDDPQLINEILDYLAEMWIQLWEEVLSKVEVDFVLFWEDIAYNKGPLISPKIFREFLTPRYIRINDFLRSHGVKIAIVDTDGDFWELIPLFQEVGITGSYPFEVQAGMDIVKFRKTFPNFQIIGGINKEALAKDKAAIDKELNKVTSIINQQGFIACADHNIPPHVSWENFIYYRNTLRNILLG